MNLPAHYDAMRAAAVRALTAGAAELDPLLLDPARDDRRGITLLTRPPAPITAVLEAIMADFRALEPRQYYYPAADIHLTVLSIISCYAGFTLALIDPAAYRQAVAAALRRVRPFVIRYAGLTASAGGIMVQGTPDGNTLTELREALRVVFRQSGLQQSIDQRYSLQTAHSTLIRFQNPLSDGPALARKLQAYAHYVIGAFEVSTLELVFNDWYQRAGNTILLETYSLLP